MDRLISLRCFLLALVFIATAGLIGCSGDDDDDASASPTPAPFDDFFRVTSMEVGGPSVGVDIDGDGSIDNSIETAMTGVVNTVVTQVTAALPETLPPQVVNQLTNNLTTTLNGIFSVEALTTALNTPIQTFQTNYLQEYAQQVDGSVMLNWYEGDIEASGSMKVDLSDPAQDLGSQTGSIGDDKTGSFSGDISLTFIFEAQGNELSTVITLAGAGTSVADYNPEKLNNGMFGGAIIITDLVELIQKIIEGVNTAAGGVLDAQQISDIIDLVETGLMTYSDVTIGNEAGFSIGITFDAESAQVKVLGG